MTPVGFLLAKSVEALPGRVMRRYAVKKRLAGSGGCGGGGKEEQEAAPTLSRRPRRRSTWRSWRRW